MTYKFNSSENEYLEVEQFLESQVKLFIAQDEFESAIILSKEQLFDLVGVLLSIQAKIKKY